MKKGEVSDRFVISSRMDAFACSRSDKCSLVNSLRRGAVPNDCAQPCPTLLELEERLGWLIGSLEPYNLPSGNRIAQFEKRLNALLVSVHREEQRASRST